MTNPPFIAMPAWIDIDAKTPRPCPVSWTSAKPISGLQGNLKTVFPEAGWGGDDGLEVTKQFLDALSHCWLVDAW
jgi:hypothetical protein